MLRHPRKLASIAILALAAALTGCGIKGPLTLPPAPDASAPVPADASKGGARESRPEPRL